MGIAGFACSWPILSLSRAAVAGIEPRLMEVSRAVRLSPADRVRKIISPAALPRLFRAFRLAAGIALIVAVTVEIAINPIGLGAAIMTAQQALRPDLMLAYLLWIGIVGYLLNTGLVVAQNRLFGRAALGRDPAWTALGCMGALPALAQTPASSSAARVLLSRGRRPRRSGVGARRRGVL